MNTPKNTGTWRSYKTFSARGDVKSYSDRHYRDVTIHAEGRLVLRSFLPHSEKQVLESGSWEIRPDGRRRFLYLKGKKSFEVITLEPTDLVLLDVETGEKTFFASLPTWKERLSPGKGDQQAYIELWSKSLIQIIKLQN